MILSEDDLLDVPPLRPDEVGGTLGDIDSHLPDGHIYRDSDWVTWAHETTHGINARIRNEWRAANGYYLLSDRGLAMARTGVRLNALAEAIPTEQRGQLYRLYLVDQQIYWNEDAAYVLDELTAYTNGAIVGKEGGLTGRFEESLEKAQEMLLYGDRLCLLTRDAGYVDQDKILGLTDWMSRVHQELKR